MEWIVIFAIQFCAVGTGVGAGVWIGLNLWPNSRLDLRRAVNNAGLCEWKCDDDFRLKTRDEIADEVIAERRQARADQQREQQERFREQWGNAVCNSPELWTCFCGLCGWSGNCERRAARADGSREARPLP